MTEQSTGKLIIVAGHTGSGKTSHAMKIANDRKNLFVYDFQNHWGNTQFYDENGTEIKGNPCKLITKNTELSKTRMRVSPVNFNIHQYTHIVKHLKGFTMVVEEATGLFPNGTISQELIQIVLSKRHTKNDFIFVFHALHRVPPQFIEFINELHLFSTYDQDKNIQAKFPKIYSKWREIQVVSESKPYHFETLLPPLS